MAALSPIQSPRTPTRSGINAPPNFGPGLYAKADVATGLVVKLSGGPDTSFVLPLMYQSGTPLGVSSATWNNASFNSLGLFEGSYVWSWGSGANADTYTLLIGSSTLPVPEPGTWALLMLGLAIAGALRLRRHA